MKIDTTKYIPYLKAVKLYGRHSTTFYYHVLNGSIGTITVWKDQKLYSVKDIEKLKDRLGEKKN